MRGSIRRSTVPSWILFTQTRSRSLLDEESFGRYVYWGVSLVVWWTGLKSGEIFEAIQWASSSQRTRSQRGGVYVYVRKECCVDGGGKMFAHRSCQCCLGTESISSDR